MGGRGGVRGGQGGEEGRSEGGGVEDERRCPNRKADPIVQITRD